jgi:mono/diheme cytochrome c family protein
MLGVVLAMASCGGATTEDASAAPPATGQPAAAGELSAEQLKNGVGPVTSLTLGALDAALVQQGEAVFTLKCAACHKLTDRYVGPALGDVLTRRTPEFVMNMVLNPAEMVERHPEVRKLLAEFMTPMPDQNVTEQEARAVLEYLRSVNDES